MSIFISSIFADGLDRDPAGVEGDGLADEAERLAAAAAARSAARSARGSSALPLATAEQAAHPEPLDLGPAQDLDRDAASWASAISAARSARKVGVATLAGRFCSSRARLAASAATRAISTALASPAVSAGVERSRAARALAAAASSSSSRRLKRSKR